MFKSQSFIFDGESSDEYGVMLYFLDDDTPIREVEFGTNVEIIEDRPARRISPIHYGTNKNQAMTFPIVFGSQTKLSDYEVDAILGWLTGHNQYKSLEYVDKGHYVKYKCFINDVSTIFINGLPTAFKATVICDGQFAYEYPIEYKYEISPVETEISLFNRSSYNGYYFPNLEITLDDNCEGVHIINQSDKSREFSLVYNDRYTASEDVNEFSYITTLNKEYSSNSNTAEDLTWLSDQIPQGNYNEILCKDNIRVLLPKNGNIISTFNGKEWKSTTIPINGTFIGCSGNNGFVAIPTGISTSQVLFSADGYTWETVHTSSELPVNQVWTSVCYAELTGFSDGYYIAVGQGNQIAVSLSGMNWNSLSITLPGEGWNKVKYGNGKAIAISTTGKHIAYCTNVSTWHLVPLPIQAKWNDIVYGDHGWCLICDSLSTSPQSPTYLHSEDGIQWDIGTMPVGSWREITYIDGIYLALSGRTYAVSLNNNDWIVNTYRDDIIDISNNGKKIIGLTSNSMLTSTLLCAKTGSFQVALPSDVSIAEIKITGELENSNQLDSEYISNGEVTLYSKSSNQTISNGFVSLTQDVSAGLGSEGVKMKADWDEMSKSVTVKYICDLNHTNEMNSALTIKVLYHHLISKDSEKEDALCITFNNKDQIITTNRDDVNIYPYFNSKFLRLLKGNNNLLLYTDGGNATVKIVCEFLRKAGGF